MRLEVNHPVYALTWLGAAGGMVFAARSASWRFWHNRTAREWGLLAASIIAALAVPVEPGARIMTPDDICAGLVPEGPVVVFDDDHYYMAG